MATGRDYRAELASVRKALLSICCLVCFLALQSKFSPAKDYNSPEQDFKSYSLAGDVRSADISPDEKFVVLDVVGNVPGSKPDSVLETNEVQVWDFKANHLVARAVLRSTETESLQKQKGRIWQRHMPSALVRYSRDGRSVLVWFDRTLYVAQASDLRTLSMFELQVPTARPVGPELPYLSAMEVSPDSQRLAVMWTFGPSKYAVDMYEMTSYARLHSWALPDGFVSGFVWGSDGESALFSIGNGWCAFPSATSGIYKVNLGSGATELLVKTVNLPSAPAMLPNDRIAFNEPETCEGFGEKPRHDFKIYDTKLKSLITSIKTRDATGWVLSSDAGDRMVTYSGTSKLAFDWGDFRGWYYDAAQQTFTVWDSHTLQPLARSRNLPGLITCTTRVSRTGHYIVIVSSGGLSYKHPVHAVYQLP